MYVWRAEKDLVAYLFGQLHNFLCDPVRMVFIAANGQLA